jgi:hypothetical protein
LHPEEDAELASLDAELFPPHPLAPKRRADFGKAEIRKWWPIINVANTKGE